MRVYTFFFSDAELPSVKKMYLKEGKTVREIGLHYGCHKTTVLKFLKRHGIPIKSRKQVNYEVASREVFQERRIKKTERQVNMVVGKEVEDKGTKTSAKYAWSW